MTKDELIVVLREHKMWLTGTGGTRAYLHWADLHWADLRGADLRGANLRVADLRGADLRGTCLRRADLRGADLRGADLRGADLRGADLSGVNLRGADLSGVNLRVADLRGADLRGTCLRRADLRGTCLRGTCLDGSIPRPTDQEILDAGLEIQDGWVYGYRTEESQHCGNTYYTPGVYTAILSRDTTTSCHPGIYLAGKAWLGENYPNVPIVRCRCRIDHLVHAEDKWRTDELEVLG